MIIVLTFIQECSKMYTRLYVMTGSMRIGDYRGDGIETESIRQDQSGT